MMKQILMSTVVLFCATPLNLAVQEFEKASDVVQAAFYADNCPAGELVQLDTAFKQLNAADQAAYEKIGAALDLAYAEVPPTDGELMHVNDQFCLAVED